MSIQHMTGTTYLPEGLVDEVLAIFRPLWTGMSTLALSVLVADVALALRYGLGSGITGRPAHKARLGSRKS